MARAINGTATAEKWARNTGGSQADYLAGVRNPRTQWQAATAASAGNYQAGVQKAIAANTFAKGVQAAGESTYQQGVADKGALRFAEGTAVSQSKYQAKVAPYLEVINSTQLPPRGPRGSPQNLQRVAAIATALNKKKMGS